jgi:uncharacterized protein YcaQ
MQTPKVISNKDARRILLHSHGLSLTSSKRLVSSALLQLIEHIGFVQVDSINTVERAHHMVLFARHHHYRQSQLVNLLEHERSVFENWTHDASMIPTAFYPYWKPRFMRERERLRTVWRRHRRQGFEAQVEQVLQHVRDQGPVMARDLGTEQKKDNRGWWDWHPSKTALEYLWRCGELAITRRNGFQKVYDLAERVIPPSVYTAPTPSRQALIDWACRSALERLGIASAREIAGFWAVVSAADVRAWCQRHLGHEVESLVVEAADGSTAQGLFARAGLVDALKEVPPPPRRLRFLSPFDPLIRDRLRTSRLFDFDYRIEVFVPQARRQYGYYVFPILQGDRLIGRIDMKHWRQDGTLLVTRLWLEPGQHLTRARQDGLQRALERLRQFTGARMVTVANDALPS